MFLTETQPNLPFSALGALMVLVIWAYKFGYKYFGIKNRKKPTRPQMTNEIKELLTCPISREIMHDPVTLIQSQQTFDRKQLCRWLLVDPSRCPLTNKDYGEKLQYIDNIGIRQILTMYLGDEAYQKYDDSSFRTHSMPPPLILAAWSNLMPRHCTIYGRMLFRIANGVAQGL